MNKTHQNRRKRKRQQVKKDSALQAQQYQPVIVTYLDECDALPWSESSKPVITQDLEVLKR